jgi:tRNA dimethylallyltransferase
MAESAARLPIILIAGPTGVGKTALSLDLAKRLRTEIVNADSMQVYRFMDIGTAKPTQEERAQVRHHLLDVVAPDEPFDAAAYADLARLVIEVMHQQGRIPLVVGGTGLYMKVLTRGICQGPEVDPSVRAALRREAEERGIKALHDELRAADPALGESLHPHDRQRIIRALEVYRSTGCRLSEWQAAHRFAHNLYPTLKIFLARSRDALYDRINRRVLEMMGSGFLEEVQGLLRRGYGPGLKPMQSLGYRQLTRHLLEGLPLDAAIEQIQRETRRYAKRQMTWFRGDPEFHRLDAEDPEAAMAWIENRLDAGLSGS